MWQTHLCSRAIDCSVDVQRLQSLRLAAAPIEFVYDPRDDHIETERWNVHEQVGRDLVEPGENHARPTHEPEAAPERRRPVTLERVLQVRLKGRLEERVVLFRLLGLSAYQFLKGLSTCTQILLMCN